MSSAQTLWGGGSHRNVEPRKAGKKLAACIAATAAVALALGFAAPQANAIELTDIPVIGDVAKALGVTAQADEGQERSATQGATREADNTTFDAYTLGDEDSTQYNGRVWVDKSVSDEDEVSFGDTKVTNDSDFLVTYSALATSTVTVGQTPTDTVFILDLSASMTWGYETSGQSVPQKQSRLQAMVDSVNSAIDTLVNANPENRIAIVTFNGSCLDNQALVPELVSGKEILNQVKDSEYLEIQDYDQNLNDGNDKATANVYCAINGNSASTSGGTNIQAGLFRGMSILAENADTKYTLDNGSKVTRIPNVILMSDGAPTTFSSAEDAGYMSYNTKGSGDNHYLEEGGWKEGVITNKSPVIRDTNYSVESGSWWATNSGQQIGAGNNNDPDSADGFMALLTASYFKNAISSNYYGSSGEEANVYTIGFGTDVQDEGMVAMANLVLNPGENLGVETNYNQVDEVATAWSAYKAGNKTTVHAAIGDGSNTLHIPFSVKQCGNKNNPSSLDYPTQYFEAADKDQLEEIFGQITSLITSSASAPTEVTGDPMSDGYLTYTDTTGQYMEIKNVTKLIFMNQDLNVTKDESSFTTDREVYVAASYDYENPAYPGQSFNTNQIEIVITNNDDSTQTLTVKIPAALIPLRTNTVTLDGNGNPTNNQVSETKPLRLCYEVGLKAGIDPTTLNGVDADYLKDNSADGKVSFYSNAYTEGGQTNKGVGATVEFEPSPTNPFYFVQEDTSLYVATGMDAGGEPEYARAAGPLDVDATYYVPMTYYNGEGANVKKVTSYVARSGETLEGYTNTDSEGLYLTEGSPRLGNLEDVTAEKPENKTGTYGYYREPTFVYDQGSTNPQEGHFVVLLGNNGRLQVDEPASLVIAKKVTAGEGLTAPDATFTFEITSADKAGQTVNAVKTTSTGDGATTEDITVEFNDQGVAKVELTANQTIELKGMAGADYSIKEVDVANGFTLDSVTGADATNVTGKDIVASGEVSAGAADETVIFTNNYSVTPATSTSLNIPLSGTKTIDGRSFQQGDEFTFTIAAARATLNAPLPQKDGKDVTSVTIKPTSGENASFAFDGEITFTKPGEYRYIIREVNYDTDNDDTTVNPGGVSYDSAFYRLNVVIVDNGDGTLRLANVDEIDDLTKEDGMAGDGLVYTANPMVQEYSGGAMQPAPNNAVQFDNNYNPDAATATIQGTKVLKVTNSDYKLKDGDFSFTIELLGSTTNAKDSYDAGDFTADNTQPIPVDNQGQPLTQAANIANGNVQFGFAQDAFTKDMIGKTYGYQITEALGDAPDNTVMDSNASRIVWITVGDDGQGHVTTTVGPNDGQSGAPNNFTFTNAYQPTGITIGEGDKASITVQKTFDGHDWTDGYTFEYTIKNTGAPAGVTAPMPDKDTIGIGSPASGNVNTGAFGEMTFEREGTYTYEITETEGALGGVTYDKHIATVTVTVTEDEAAGTLSAQVSYDNSKALNDSDRNVKDASAFTNTYAPSEITLSGDKALAVRKKVAGADTDEDFSFTATLNKDASSDTSGIKGYADGFKLTGEVTDAFKDGDTKDVKLSEVTFTKPGTYVFDVVEDGAGSAPTGWTYDNATKQITVKVTDENGQLKADVQGDAPTFTNTYFDEEDAKDVFATDGDGNKAGNSVDGKLVGVGDVLTYEVKWMNTKATEAAVTVTDTVPAGTELVEDSISDGGSEQGGAITWNLGTKQPGESGTVSFRVKVTENVAGATVDNQASITVGDNPEVKTNTTENPVPEKEETSGTGSVAEGTELTYQISFKNTDGDKASATVVDELTKGQEYVKGSSQLNGQQTGDPDIEGAASDGQKLTWKLDGLSDGEDVVLTFKVKTTRDAGTSVDNTATVNGHKTNTVTTPYPSDTKKDVALASDPKASVDGKLVGVGDELVYTIDWAADADGELTVTDEVPEGTENPTEISDGGSVAEDGTITWDLGTVSAGDKGTVSFKVTVSEAAAKLDSVTNTAYLKIGNNKPKPTNTTTNTVPEKTVDKSEANVGDELTYTVAFTSDSDATATVEDELADGLTYEDGSATVAINDGGAVAAKPTTSGQKLSWQVDGLKKGDAVLITFKVTVGDQLDGGSASNQATVNGHASNVVQTTIDKTPSPADGQGTISVTKKLEGRDWLDTDSFTFTLAADENNPAGAVLPGNPTVTISAGTAEHTAQFDPITFTAEGTYTFYVTENATDIPGVTASTERKAVTFTVTDAKNGTYNIVSSEEGAVEFTNTYAPSPAVAGLTATKTVNGQSKGVEAGAFQFKIEAVDGAPMPAGPQGGVVGNDVDGVIDFGTFSFDTPGTYTYRVSEVDGGKAGYTYDDTVYTVTFTVADTDQANGSLEVTRAVTANGQPAESVTFSNGYQPNPVTTDAQAPFSGTKTVRAEHGEFQLEAGQFSFAMESVAAPDGVEAPQPSNGSTVENAADGSYSFGTLTFTEPGEYVYAVREIDGGLAGVTYDGTVYTVSFTVEDHDGQLVITKQVVSSANGEASATGMDFTNVYNDGRVSVSLSGTKVLETNGYEGAQLEQGAYTFVLLDENGTEVARTANGTPSGNAASFEFGPLTYTADDLGTHTYKVCELGVDGEPGTGGEADGVSYSTEVYTIAVTVSADEQAEGAGALKAEVDTAGKQVVFTNGYEPEPGTVGPNGSVQISGTKALTGRDMAAGEFAFELVQGGEVVDEATNSADGTFTFGKDITFTEPGTYTYLVREKAGTLGGVTYDKAAYAVVVTVTEDAAAHKLVPKVSYQLAGEDADGMAFSNSYEAGPAGVVIGLAKKLEGAELGDGQFSFEIEAATEGAPMPEETTVANDVAGGISFGPITFTEPGEYDYVVSEVNDGQEGVAYDEDADRTVHVSVTDNGQGSLVAEVTYPEGSTFVNTAEPEEPENPENPEEPGQPETPGTPAEPGSPTEPSQPNGGSNQEALPVTGDYLPAIAGGIALVAVALVAGGVALRRRRR